MPRTGALGRLVFERVPVPVVADEDEDVAPAADGRCWWAGVFLIDRGLSLLCNMEFICDSIPKLSAGLKLAACIQKQSTLARYMLPPLRDFEGKLPVT
jgi:hypothetical protein